MQTQARWPRVLISGSDETYLPAHHADLVSGYLSFVIVIILKFSFFFLSPLQRLTTLSRHHGVLVDRDTQDIPRIAFSIPRVRASIPYLVDIFSTHCEYLSPLPLLFKSAPSHPFLPYLLPSRSTHSPTPPPPLPTCDMPSTIHNLPTLQERVSWLCKQQEGELQIPIQAHFPSRLLSRRCVWCGGTAGDPPRTAAPLLIAIEGPMGCTLTLLVLADHADVHSRLNTATASASAGG